MNKVIAVLTFLCSGLLGMAQDQDPKAKQILDELSKVTKTYKSITTEIQFSRIGADKKPIEKAQVWKVQVKGQKFRLEIPGSSIVCDSKTVWNYNSDAKEVTIKNFDPESDDQNPSKIFTLYESGYKFKYDKEEKVGTALCHVIDLYPAIKPEKKKFHTVKLYVDKLRKQVVRMRMLMRDGSTQDYLVKSMKTNLEIPDKTFVFDTKTLKPDQISDERD
ncbi:MAG TPA: outer membrane lipoprotein carrier protein LolA [Bacteroidia bacterium]|nr:outer membrane lipoprotein carrier protein LolA [Bacteroidia bacterium]